MVDDIKKEKDMKVQYLFYNNGYQDMQKEVDISFDYLKRSVLLNLYYADMLMMKVSLANVLELIQSHLYWMCASNEHSYFRDHVFVPRFEELHMLASIHKDRLIEIEEIDKACFVKLTDSGKEICEEYM